MNKLTTNKEKQDAKTYQAKKIFLKQKRQKQNNL